MTSEELVRIPAKQIRKDKNLMQLYIERYKAVFGYEPNCASCSFNSDFRKFKMAINKGNKITLKTKEMATEYKIKRKHQGDILTYKKDGKIHRLYGRLMTDSFAEGFLSNGTKEQLEARVKMFEKIPQKVSNEEKAQVQSEAPQEKESAAQEVIDIQQITDLNLAEYKIEVEKISDPEVIEKLYQAEKDGKDRAGAYAILEDRAAEMDGKENDSLPRKRKGRKNLNNG